jgi:serine O-acetyltransferase
VIVGANSQVLGGFTVGDNARIGSNAVVVKDVPDGATVVGIPAREASSKSANADLSLNEPAAQAPRPCFDAYGQSADVKDPLVVKIEQVTAQARALEERLAALEARQPAAGDGQSQLHK